MKEQEQVRTLSAAGSGDSQQYRELRFRNAQLRKACGKQGQTIYQLRSELAEARELTSKIDRGDLRRAERIAREQAEYIVALEAKLADQRTWSASDEDEAGSAEVIEQ